MPNLHAVQLFGEPARLCRGPAALLSQRRTAGISDATASIVEVSKILYSDSQESEGGSVETAISNIYAEFSDLLPVDSFPRRPPGHVTSTIVAMNDVELLANLAALGAFSRANPLAFPSGDVRCA
jgi:hypothetical protein